MIVRSHRSDMNNTLFIDIDHSERFPILLHLS